MKRRTGIRGVTLAAGIAVALVGCTFAWAAPPEGKGGGGGGGGKGPSYKIIKLDTDDGAGGTLSGDAFDINDSGLVVGIVDELAAYWTVTDVDGELQSSLHFLDNSSLTYSVAFGCNGWGEIVGHGDHGSSAVYWASTNSPAVELPAPLPFRVARAINKSSVICGGSSEWVGTELQQKALAWSFTGGQWKYLELTPLGDPGEDEQGNPLPDQSFAVAISDADTDTGVITIAGDSNGNAVIWTVSLDNSGGLLAGPAMILDVGEANGLNSNGTICGWQVGPNNSGAGVVWVDGGPAEHLDLYQVPGYTHPHSVVANDINNNGLVVGNEMSFALIWPNRDASSIALNDYLPKNRSPFSALSKAWAVNDANKIVGRGWLEGISQNLPFLAIPE